MFFDRKSPRWRGYNYSFSGMYFVTICTKDHENYFGKIVNKKMILNDLGVFCSQEIERLLERKTVEVHEYVVMSNHVHILLYISEFTDDLNVGYISRDALAVCSQEYANSRDALEVRPGHANSVSVQEYDNIIKNPNYEGPKLGQIINVFKGNVSKYAKSNNIEFGRQGRYNDRIVRDENEYNNKKHYIKTNPERVEL